MKTVINNTKGIVSYEEGNQIILETTGEIQIKGNVTIAGTTTTNARIDDRVIELAYGTTGSRSSGLEDAGIIIERGDDANVFFGWDESADLFTVGTGTFTGTSDVPLSLTLAGINASMLTGSVSLKAPAITGSATITVPVGGLILGSTAVTATAAEINAFGFLSVTAGTAAASKALVLNSSSGITGIASLTSTAFVGDLTGDVTGDLTGDVTGDITGNAATVTTITGLAPDTATTAAAQTSVTSLGTLSSLAISGNLTVDTNTLFVDSSSNEVGIGTTSPGATLDVRGGHMILTDGDVSHGITNVAPTEAFGDIGPIHGTRGGLMINGLSDQESADARSLALRGICNDTHTDTVPTVELIGAKRSGSSIQALASAETVLQVSNHTTNLMTVLGSGNVGIGTTTPTEALDINSDAIRIRDDQTPASASATGTAGIICWDSDYIYVCTATNTWKRVAIATW